MSKNKDQVQGKIKEAAGVLSDDDQLKNEGKEDQRVGDAKSVVHDAADKAEELIEDIDSAVRKK